MTAAETGDGSPAFWSSLLRHTAEPAREIGATTYMTGKLGDDVMGNWWDDSDQVAGLLARGRVREAIGQAFAWSKLLHVPIAMILWRASLSLLPAKFDLASHNRMMGIPDWAETREDSLTPEFRDRTGPPLQNLFSREWMQARPDPRKNCRT